MKAFFIFLFSLLASVVSMAQNVKFDIEADVHRLDTVVANSHKYDAQKMHDINYIKRSTGDFVTPTERYNFYKRLYDEYMKFDSDSAKHYASMCQKVASRTNMHNYEVAAILDRAYIFITCGELIDAQRILNTISTPIDSLPDDVRMKYAITMLEYRIRLDLKSFWENKYGDKEACLAVWNKYNRYMPDDMWQKHYYESSLTDHDVLKKLQADLANTQRPSIKAAMLYVSIARQYKKRGADEKLYLHYLILSAINDVKSSNREASSLIFIVNSPHICAGTERAFNYAMLCTENAKSYKDVGRSFDIVKAHAKITRAYQKRLEYNIMLCIGCMAMLVLAILAVVLLYRNVVRKRRAQAELLSQIEKANVSLEESVKKEQQALEKLRHSNALLRD